MRFLVLCFSILSIALPINVIATPKYLTVFTKTDARFDVYKRRFEYEYKKHTGESLNTKKVLINFVENPNKYCRGCTATIKAGLCKRYGKTKEILINRGYYNSISNHQKEELVFHELAHCSLDWDHTESHYKGTPLSIMSSTMFSDDNFYKKHRSALLKELFTSDVSQIVKELQADESH